MTHINTSIGRLHVDQAGSGLPILLWHSFFLDNAQWKRILPALTKDRTVIAVEGPAHGRSGPQVGALTMDDCATAAREIIDSLGIDQVDWVGCAWGGHVGIAFADRYPERTRSLVTVGTPLQPLTRAERPKIAFLHRLYGMLGPKSFVVKAVTAAQLAPKTIANDPEAVSIVTEAFRQADRRAMAQAMTSAILNRPDMTARMRSLDVPSLILAGTEDHLWSPETARTAMTGVARTRIASVDGASHIAPLERPEATLREMRAFWSERSAQSAV